MILDCLCWLICILLDCRPFASKMKILLRQTFQIQSSDFGLKGAAFGLVKVTVWKDNWLDLFTGIAVNHPQNPLFSLYENVSYRSIHGRPLRKYVMNGSFSIWHSWNLHTKYRKIVHLDGRAPLTTMDTQECLLLEINLPCLATWHFAVFSIITLQRLFNFGPFG